MKPAVPVANWLQDRFSEIRELNLKLATNSAYCDLIETVAGEIVESLRRGGKVFFCGNGGSAADAQHLAAELLGRYYASGRSALAAHALTTNTSALTAIANDYGYDSVFSRQLEGLGQKGDVLVAISTSGKSQSVIRAVATARDMGMITVGFTGTNGNLLEEVADYCFRIPSSDTPRIQEAHIQTGHLICELVERHFV